MRNSRAGIAPAELRTLHSPTARNGNAEFDTSMSATAARTSRALGPDNAAADHCSVTDVTYTSRSGQSIWSNDSRCCITCPALMVVVVIR